VKRSILVALLLVACLFSGAHPTVWAKRATAEVASATYTYDSPSIARVDVHGIEGAEASPAQLSGALAWSASPSVVARGSSTTPNAGSVATEAAGTGGIVTTAHGATRIAGEAATRGGVLSEAEIGVVREAGTLYNQSNGAIARVLQQADGRFSVVVDGDRGLITSFQNLSQSSLDRLAKNYGWELP
jgi:hypothetical protein